MLSARRESYPTPAETPLLLGYVKSQEHLNWIHNLKRHNLRADGRVRSVVIDAGELAVDLVVLYGESMPEADVWRVHASPTCSSAPGMAELKYPDPGGDLYQCLVLEPIPRQQWPTGLTMQRLEAIHERVKPTAAVGAPGNDLA